MKTICTQIASVDTPAWATSNAAPNKYEAALPRGLPHLILIQTHPGSSSASSSYPRPSH